MPVKCPECNSTMSRLAVTGNAASPNAVSHFWCKFDGVYLRNVASAPESGISRPTLLDAVKGRTFPEGNLGLLARMIADAGGLVQFVKNVTAVRQLAIDNDIWSGHERFPVSDWQDEVAANYTRLGYWDWVQHRIESEESEHV